MIEKSKIEQVKRLIKNGFDLELISFELDIPIEDIKQYKLELETPKKVEPDEKKYSKIKTLRRRYKRLYSTRNKEDENGRREGLSQQDIEQINTIIAEIEEAVKEIEKLSNNQRRNRATIILNRIKKIQERQLTIEQAEKIYSLLELKELKNIKKSESDSIEFYMNRAKRMIVRKITEAIDIAQSETEEIDELKALRRRLTLQMGKTNQLAVNTVEGKIGKKIQKIKQTKAFEELRSNVSTDIKNIIQEIANGTLNIEEANKIINNEAKKRVEEKPKNKFTLTEEQQKRQIIIQIKTALMEKPEQYHIENPEIAVKQIQELCGGELEQAIRTVVKNLIKSKDYERAKSVCDSFINIDKQSQVSKDIKGLKKEIRNHEIGDIVLKLINMKGSKEEQIACFELIEKGIKKQNIKLEAIYLGKSQDGSRTILLSDIWDDKTKTREK